jgi:LysM repeat protein
MASRAHQFTILLAVLAFGILGAAIIGVAYYVEQIVKPEQAALETIREQQHSRDNLPDPGLKEYDAAIALIRSGDLPGARDRLAYLMRYYPESARFREAKRVLGEINLDLLLSDDPAPGKTKYTVKSGDSGLAAIAGRYRCTVDYLMRANGLTGTVIHIGDEVWVTPLIFILEARLKERVLTVYRVEAAPEGTTPPSGAERPAVASEVFFKEYPIVDLNLPPTVKVPSSAEVNDKPGWLPNGKRVQFGQSGYHAAHRWLQTARPGLVVQPAPENPDEASVERKSGILLAQADLNELYTYIRTGTELRLRE